MGLTYIPAMLRMRKKPPADMPQVNSGKPWSEMDLADLADCLEDRIDTRTARFPG